MDFVDALLYLAYGLFFLVTAASVFFPFLYSNRTVKGVRRAVFSVVLFVLMFSFNYFLADGTAVALGVGPAALRWVGGTLTMVYCLLGFCVVGIVFLELKKFIRYL